MFFDELGPPWPKHSCTDNGQSTSAELRAHDHILGPTGAPAAKTPPPLYDPDEWRPLLAEELAQTGDFDRVRMPRRDRLPSRFIYLPTGWAGDAPVYWRWCKDNPSFLEVSCIRLTDESDLQTRVFRVPAWLRNDEECAQYQATPETISPEALNAIGFALSFAWRMHEGQYWHLGLPGVNFPKAKLFFERAAASGYWAATNNLGVMYRDGLGVPRNLAKAHELFHRAAQSLEMTPLRHLATCYRDGIGCECDPAFAAFLEELIAVGVEEQKSAA